MLKLKARTRGGKKPFPPTTPNAIMRELVLMLDEKNVTQAEFCRVLGVHPNAIFRWRHGFAFPSIELVALAGRLLGYRLEWVKDQPPSSGDAAG